MVALPLAMKLAALLLGLIDICVRLALLAVGVCRLVLALERARAELRRKERRRRRQDSRIRK